MSEGYTYQGSNKKSILNIKTIAIIAVVLVAVIIGAVVLVSNLGDEGITGSNNGLGKIIGTNSELAGTSYGYGRIVFTGGNNVTVTTHMIPSSAYGGVEAQYTLNGDQLTITRDIYGTPEYHYATFAKNKQLLIFYDEVLVKDGLQYDKVSGKYEIFSEEYIMKSGYYEGTCYVEFKDGNKVTYFSSIQHTYPDGYIQYYGGNGIYEGTYSIDGNNIGMNFSDNPIPRSSGSHDSIIKGTIISKDLIDISGFGGILCK
ncbi:MAG: hypothetical protein LBE76_00890 [Nitrososphaerota archaeon]|jgi:hypothetical protein|nr:hypothetical protein [Nitrososphaerota archaeon]